MYWWCNIWARLLPEGGRNDMCVLLLMMDVSSMIQRVIEKSFLGAFWFRWRYGHKIPSYLVGVCMQCLFSCVCVGCRMPIKYAQRIEWSSSWTNIIIYQASMRLPLSMAQRDHAKGWWSIFFSSLLFATGFTLFRVVDKTACQARSPMQDDPRNTLRAQLPSLSSPT
jgi:hypothetical protein